MPGRTFSLTDEQAKRAMNSEFLLIETLPRDGENRGGQHHNGPRNYAIKITHLPTGNYVSCQSERSSHKNKDRALDALRVMLGHKGQLYDDEEVTNKG